MTTGTVPAGRAGSGSGGPPRSSARLELCPAAERGGPQRRAEPLVGRPARGGPSHSAGAGRSLRRVAARPLSPSRYEAAARTVPTERVVWQQSEDAAPAVRRGGWPPFGPGSAGQEGARLSVSNALRGCSSRYCRRGEDSRHTLPDRWRRDQRRVNGSVPWLNNDVNDRVNKRADRGVRACNATGSYARL